MSHDFISSFVSHSIYLRIGCNGGETIDFSSILSFKCSTVLHKFCAGDLNSALQRIDVYRATLFLCLPLALAMPFGVVFLSQQDIEVN